MPMSSHLRCAALTLSLPADDRSIAAPIHVAPLLSRAKQQHTDEVRVVLEGLQICVLVLICGSLLVALLVVWRDDRKWVDERRL